MDETVRQGFSGIRVISQGRPSSTQNCMEDQLEIEVNLNVNNVSSKRGVPQGACSPSIEYCTHNCDLFLLKDDKLVKPGDKFASHDDFIQYLNVNAKRWLFYYKCSDSRRPKTEHETYTYNCVYLRNKEKYKKKGIRQRNNNLKTDCPCKIKLKHLSNEKELTAVYVCNHHDHQLSEEEFYKLQHGRRLPPHIKEEIMDFLALQVDVGKIRKYVLMETGFNMSRPFFHAIERNMKSKSVERPISDERVKELSGKIGVVNEMYICDDEETDNQVPQPSQNDESLITKLGQELTVGSLSTPLTDKTRKRSSSLKKCSTEPIKLAEDTNKQRKLDSSIQPSTCSSGTMQSLRNLQVTAKCEIQQNPWTIDQTIPVLPNRTKNREQNRSRLSIINVNKDIATDETIYSCHIVDSSEFNDHDVKEDDVGDKYIVYETTSEVEYICEENLDNSQTHEESKETIDNSISNDSNVLTSSEIVNSETVGIYDGEQVQYVSGSNDSNRNRKACDAAVQTCVSSKPGHSYVPVFNVYMKDGNVTGFILDNTFINKDGVEKGVQANREIMDRSNTQASEEAAEDIPIETEPNVIEEVKISRKSGDTYTKHEYIHKYNIDQYMVQPHFPKYIETLAKETCTNVLHMFTNVYNEKAMFKMTTTQRGKEGNTRIWYITDPNLRRRIKRFSSEEKNNRERLGKNLKDIFVLREKVKLMKNRNNELATRNKYLEDVALQLVKEGVVKFEPL